VKTGSGTQVLSGSNIYDGPTTINGGVLSISSDQNLGPSPAIPTANQLIINDTGTLQTNGTFALSASRGIGLGDATLNVASGTLSERS
jgi:autotransporter-associated beta strand protein